MLKVKPVEWVICKNHWFNLIVDGECKECKK